jgi:hypothetical protein
MPITMKRIAIDRKDLMTQGTPSFPLPLCQHCKAGIRLSRCSGASQNTFYVRKPASPCPRKSGIAIRKNNTYVRSIVDKELYNILVPLSDGISQGRRSRIISRIYVSLGRQQ